MKILTRTWRFWAPFLVLALASAFVEFSSASRRAAPALASPVYYNLSVAVQSSEDFNMLRNLAASVKGHERLLNREAPYTVFAPRNVAFTRFSKALVNEMWGSGNALWEGVFWHHVAEGNFREPGLKDGQTIKMLDGSAVQLTRHNGQLNVDGVPVVDTLVTQSSVIYAIDTLLLPESAREAFRRR